MAPEPRRPRRILISPVADRDLDDLAGYLEREASPRRAAAFVADLTAKFRAVAATPRAYPSRSALAPGLRVAVLGRRGHLVFFREDPDGDAVIIERVLHGSRDTSRLF